MITLSGGEFGGVEVDSTGWEIGETRDFGGWVYKRIDETQAVYVGAA